MLFAAPEYNYSVSGALKNALDWCSRTPNAWEGKPAAVMGAGGGLGASRAQYHLRQIGVYLNLLFLNKPEVQIQARGCSVACAAWGLSLRALGAPPACHPQRTRAARRRSRLATATWPRASW